MISIIIASVNPDLLASVKQNIADTIGLTYEVIAIENSTGSRGICAVYNEGAAAAKYELLCFMHEDLLFRSDRWGLQVAKIMEDPLIGLLGVAGSDYKSLVPSGWACPGIEQESSKVNVVQQYKYKAGDVATEYFNSKQEDLAYVASIDGVWMCTRKSIVKDLQFDSDLLPHFHGYDIDFSLSVAKKYRVAVTFKVLLEHFSEGHFEADWLKSVFAVNKKHVHSLPLNIGNHETKVCRTGEKFALKRLLGILTQDGKGIRQKIRLLWEYQLYRSLGLGKFVLFNFKVLIGRY